MTKIIFVLNKNKCMCSTRKVLHLSFLLLAVPSIDSFDEAFPYEELIDTCIVVWKRDRRRIRACCLNWKSLTTAVQPLHVLQSPIHEQTASYCAIYETVRLFGKFLPVAQWKFCFTSSSEISTCGRTFLANISTFCVPCSPFISCTKSTSWPFQSQGAFLLFNLALSVTFICICFIYFQ